MVPNPHRAKEVSRLRSSRKPWPIVPSEAHLTARAFSGGLRFSSSRHLGQHRLHGHFFRLLRLAPPTTNPTSTSSSPGLAGFFPRPPGTIHPCMGSKAGLCRKGTIFWTFFALGFASLHLYHEFQHRHHQGDDRIRARLASQSAQDAQPLALPLAEVLGDRSSPSHCSSRSSRGPGTAPLSVNTTASGIVCLASEGDSHGEASPRRQLVVFQLFQVQQEERDLLLYLHQQLAATGRIIHRIICLGTDRAHTAVALATGLGGAATTKAQASAPTFEATQEPQPPESGDQRGRQADGAPAGAAVETAQPSLCSSGAGKASGGGRRRVETHQSPQRGPDTGRQPPLQRGRAPVQGRGCSGQASDAVPAQPNQTAWAGQAAASRTGQIVARICFCIAQGPGQGDRCARRTPYPSARPRVPSCGEGETGATRDPGAEQGCGRDNLRSRQRRGPPAPGLARRFTGLASPEKAAHDTRAAQKQYASLRARQHPEATWQGWRERWRWHGRWPGHGTRSRWRSLLICSLAAPQLGCTSLPAGSSSMARLGDSELREQPKVQSTSAEVLAKQIHDFCLSTQHSVLTRSDYKSPQMAQLQAELWHLQVTWQYGSYFCGSADIFPRKFSSEWDDPISGHESMRDSVDPGSPQQSASPHGQIWCVEPVDCGAPVHATPSSRKGRSRGHRALYIHSEVGASVQCTAAPISPPPSVTPHATQACLPSALVKGGSRRSFPGARTHKCRVKFNFSVSFWFPSEGQLCLHRASCDTSPTVNPTAVPATLSAPRDALSQSRSAACHSQVYSASFYQAEHVGLRSPVLSHSLQSSVAAGLEASPHAALYVSSDQPYAFSLHNVAPLDASSQFPYAAIHVWDSTASSLPAQSFEALPPIPLGAPLLQAEHVGFRSPIPCSPRPFAVATPKASPFCAPHLASSQSLSGFSRAAPHEALSQSCSPGPLPGHPAPAVSFTCHSNTCDDIAPCPSLVFARKKPQAKQAAFKLGAAPFQAPRPKHPGLSRPLSHAGHYRTEAPATSASSSQPPSPFSSFDAVNGARILAGEPSWPSDQYIIFARDTARLPGNPLARFLKFELVDHPGPQVAITQDHGVGLFRAVVFDFRPLTGEVETLDVPPVTAIVDQVRVARSLRDPHLAMAIVTGHACSSLANGKIVAPTSQLSVETDLVLFKLWKDGEPVDTWRPFQFGDARPPVPPIPEEEHATRAIAEPAI